MPSDTIIACCVLHSICVLRGDELDIGDGDDDDSDDGDDDDDCAPCTSPCSNYRKSIGCIPFVLLAS